MNADFAWIRALICFICILGPLTGAGLARAETWQEQRDAGFLAFSNADYAESAEHLEKALAGARAGQASPEQLGSILERLTTAYFAVRLFRRAKGSIAQWDEILEASAGEPWAEQQRTDRDVLAVLVAEVLGEPEPETAAPDPVPATEPAGEEPAGSAEASAPAIEPDTPFEPDEPIAVPAEQTAEADETAALPPSSTTSGRYAIHLASISDFEAVEDSWQSLQESYADLLADKDFEVRQVEVEDQGIYYRIYAVPYADAAAAESACRALAAGQQYCAVVTLD